MGVADIGVPGQPATDLTSWQAAISAALNGSDETVDERIATEVGAVVSASPRIWRGAVYTDDAGFFEAYWDGGPFPTPPTVMLTGQNQSYVSVATLTSLTTTGITGQGMFHTGEIWIPCSRDFLFHIFAIGDR